MTSNDSAITVEGITKRFGDFTAVDELSFTVKRGEIFAMIGPNGAGKSTTIRMILDVIKADSGQISVLGGPLTEETKNRVGYLPEERGLYKNVPLVQLLGYFGQLKGMNGAQARQRATEWLERLDLGEHLKSKLTALSKGMAQKVQFIATVLHQPDLVIIDEPFSGLDPVNTQILKGLINDMRDEGRAVVMSTHQMHQVEQMADRVLMISKGRRVLYGDIGTVRSQYAQHAVTVQGSGDWASLPGVNRVELNGGDTATLYLNEGVVPDDVMQALAVGEYRVERFERALPSLEEIFIRAVGGEVKEGAS